LKDHCESFLKKLINMQERIIRGIAGTLGLISIALSVTVSTNWLYLAGFVSFNLLQSSLTQWCLMNNILTKLGIPK